MKASGPGGPGFEVPHEHFFGTAAMLALAVHVLLAAALMLGMHWQSRAPDIVTVELWQPPPAPVARLEPPKVEAPKPAPPPPPPAKPEPRIEKPDIALKDPPKPKPKPKPEPKPVPKPEPKPEPKPKPVPVAKPAPPPPDETLAKQLLAQALERHDQARAAEREREALTVQLEREAQAGRERARNDWISKIQTKVRANVVMPLGVKDDVRAEVLVTLLPTGEVLDAKLFGTSGHDGYDNAVLRAVLKSSPLPKPDRAELFERSLRLIFTPRD